MGPVPIRRMSDPIFHRLVAMVRSAPCAATSTSSVAWAWKWLTASLTGMRVSLARRAVTIRANCGCELMPVPTAVPPSGTRESSSMAAWARRIDSSICPA